MFSRMDGQRIETRSAGQVPLDVMMRDGVPGTPDVAALASLGSRKLCVLVWHYHDDDVPGPDAAVELSLDHLPFAAGEARLAHYRIDGKHSNAFTQWKLMGSPTAPNDAQYARRGCGSAPRGTVGERAP